MTGLLGFSSGYHAMMNCDTLLMLGTDFPYQQFYPEDATIIQVDIRGEQIGRRTKVDLGLIGDVKTTLTTLIPKLQAKNNATHLNHSLEHYREARKGLDDLATGQPGRKPIHPQYVAKMLDELAGKQAIGAQVSHPGRQVVSLSGDGGLAMLMGDLLSLRQLQLPVKMIVLNNSSLAFVE